MGLAGDHTSVLGCSQRAVKAGCNLLDDALAVRLGERALVRRVQHQLHVPGASWLGNLQLRGLHRVVVEKLAWTPLCVRLKKFGMAPRVLFAGTRAASLQLS